MDTTEAIVAVAPGVTVGLALDTGVAVGPALDIVAAVGLAPDTGVAVGLAPDTGVAVGLAPDTGVAFRYSAVATMRQGFARHRAKMAAHFAGTAGPNLAVQKVDMTSRKGKNRVQHRA